MAALCLNVLHGTKQILGMVMMSRLLGEATDATSIVGFGMSPVAVGYVVVNVIAADVLKLEGHQRSIARKDVQVRRHTRHEMYEIKGGQKTDRRETVIRRGTLLPATPSFRPPPKDTFQFNTHHSDRVFSRNLITINSIFDL